MRFLGVGARRLLKLSDADQPVHCYRALKQCFGSKFDKITRNSQKRCRDRDHGARDAYYSPRRSRSVSRSVSPGEERTYKSHDRSPRHRSISRSLSPQNEEHVKLRRQHSPGEIGKRVHDEDYVRAHDEGYFRSNAPGRKSGSPSRSRSRSYSPR